jgi:hypothetical protein
MYEIVAFLAQRHSFRASDAFRYDVVVLGGRLSALEAIHAAIIPEQAKKPI